MAAVILSRVNRREFGGLITASITGNLLAIYTNVGRLEALEGCNTYPTAAVLRSAIREKSQALLEEIFFLLQAIHEIGRDRGYRGHVAQRGSACTRQRN